MSIDTLARKLIPAIDRLTSILDDYDAVTQQQLLEFMTARHALRTVEHADYVVDSMHKHVKQLIQQ